MKKEENPHEGCPNRYHCTKDESKCCYLVNNHCILKYEDCEEYL